MSQQAGEKSRNQREEMLWRKFNSRSNLQVEMGETPDDSASQDETYGAFRGCNGGVPLVMDRCESWTIKKAEHRIDAFELWCWRRLESPVDCKEIKPVHPKGDQS